VCNLDANVRAVARMSDSPDTGVLIEAER